MVIEPGLGDDRYDRDERDDDGDNIGGGTDDDVDALAIFLGTDAVVFFLAQSSLFLVPALLLAFCIPCQLANCIHCLVKGIAIF